jgi:hypothetical protein
VRLRRALVFGGAEPFRTRVGVEVWALKVMRSTAATSRVSGTTVPPRRDRTFATLTNIAAGVSMPELWNGPKSAQETGG